MTKNTKSKILGGFTQLLENGIVFCVAAYRKSISWFKREFLFPRNMCEKTKATMPFFSAGFTLVELMVTVSVMTLVSSVVLYENSKFNSTILLTNLGYEIALTARQAQVFGLSSKIAQIGGSTQVGYGIYFDLDDSQRFILFVDTNTAGGNKYSYQEGEAINIIGINNRNQVFDICTLSGTTWTCAVANSLDSLRKTSISFLRPNPEPEFRDSAQNKITADAIKIVLKNISSETDKRCVLVTLAGQISVKSQTACDATSGII
ncbi:MAG: prepilin-type N-terminal cleavage/methylation domain-containing protein [Patescibacteria group bacterium]